MGSSLGKLLACFMVDTLGTYLSLTFSYAGIALCIYMLSMAESEYQVAMCCIGFEVFNGCCYPAIQSRIANWYKIESQNPQAIETGSLVLSVSSRLGGLSVLFIYGALVKSIGWRPLCYAVGLLVASGVGWTTLFINDSPKKKVSPGKPFTLKAVKDTISDCVFNAGFWIFMIGFGVIKCIRRVDNLMGIYLKDTADIDPGTATQYVMAHPAGYLFGLFVIAPIYKSLTDPNKKLIFLRILYVLCIAATGVLCFAGHGNALMKVACVFALTALTTVQYYVVSGTFSISMGANCGFVSAFSDMVSYVFVSQVFGFSSGILESYGWGAFWGALGGLLVISGVCYEIFLRYWFFPKMAAAGEKKKAN